MTNITTGIDSDVSYMKMTRGPTAMVGARNRHAQKTLLPKQRWQVRQEAMECKSSGEEEGNRFLCVTETENSRAQRSEVDEGWKGSRTSITQYALGTMLAKEQQMELYASASVK